jgi:hypothetical protein
MRIKIGVEIYPGGRSIASALDYPGCFANGSDSSEAILRIPDALVRFKEWVDSHTPDSWMKELGDFSIHLDESFNVYRMNESYDLAADGVDIEAFYRHDWKVLTDEEVRRGLLILQWSRADLLELVAGLTPEQMQQDFEGERWSISGVLRHVANAEHWYLDRLSLAPCDRDHLPSDPFERLDAVRRQLNQTLSTFAGLNDVRGIEGEIWSPRKILRRAAWHEIDHIEHIFKLIAKL